MDFTKLPRELIYKDRESLDEFGVCRPRDSFGDQLYNKLLDLYCIRKDDPATEQLILQIMNDACYIMTMVGMEKRPILRIDRYREIARSNTGYLTEDQRECIMYSVTRCLLLFVYPPYGDKRVRLFDRWSSYIWLNELNEECEKCSINTLFTKDEDDERYFDLKPRILTPDIIKDTDWAAITDDCDPVMIGELEDAFGEAWIEQADLALYLSAASFEDRVEREIKRATRRFVERTHLTQEEIAKVWTRIMNSALKEINSQKYQEFEFQFLKLNMTIQQQKEKISELEEMLANANAREGGLTLRQNCILFYYLFNKLGYTFENRKMEQWKKTIAAITGFSVNGIRDNIHFLDNISNRSVKHDMKEVESLLKDMMPDLARLIENDSKE